MKNKGLEDSWMYDMCHHLLVVTDDEAKANMLIDTYHFLKKKKFKDVDFSGATPRMIKRLINGQ